MSRKYQSSQTTTLLSFSPAQSNEEAGLTALMNEKYHVGLVKSKGKLTLRYQLGVVKHIENEIKMNNKSVYLRIDGTSDLLFFTYSTDGIDYRNLGKIITTLISNETAGGFTEIYPGLFASGNGTMSQTPAEYDWFEYIGK